MSEWREIEEIERRLARIERKLDRLLRDIVAPITSFKIIQLGENDMPAPKVSIVGIAPGATAKFQGFPLDANGNIDALPAGILPVWVSSDTVNAPFVADPADKTGLTGSVTASASAPGGTAFTLTLSATLADGTVPTSGPTDVPFLALAVKSFVIGQL